MLIKKQDELKELLILKALDARWQLDEKTRNRLFRLESGLEGEANFLAALEKSEWNALFFADLKLKIHFSNVQIDTMAISRKTIHLFEVKNFTGEYYYSNGHLFMKNEVEVKNPLHQVQNIEIAVRQQLKSWGFDYQIIPWVVFVSPEFVLTQSIRTDPIIFPNQIEKKLKELGVHSFVSREDRELAQRFMALHDSKLSFIEIPPYSKAALKKGLTCRSCNQIGMTVKDKTCFCPRCGMRESMYCTLLEASRDFSLLHPGQKLTVAAVSDFCGKKVSKQAIRTALMKEYQLVKNGRASYYV